MLKFILSACLLMPCVASAQSVLTGIIRDSESEEPLTGATVKVVETGEFGVADANGRFRFENLESGNYNVLFTFVGYQEQHRQVNLNGGKDLIVYMNQITVMTDAVIVSATRATDKTPTTHTTIQKEALQEQNFGQDLPFLLNWTPSVVTTSDAGTGVGYTGIRIRGSDATRINVTINGIPYNDSESQGTFWVDIPDIASSSQSVQIQRGVGTSTNGAGAFGASINLQTNLRNDTPYAEISNAFGSFNTRRHTLNFGSGLLNNHWIIDGRVSRISSDGFIDRAEAKLNSYYFSAGFYVGKTMLKGITFGGKERTYQSWYGVPQSRLENDTEAMLVTAMNEGWNEEQTNNLLSSSSRTFNPYTYKNQVDDYTQDHYQVHFSHQFNNAFTWNTALHYTPGSGFYEEYRHDADFEDYGLAPVAIGDSLIESTDLIRRRWLDNDFYGFTYSLNFDRNKWNLIAGGAWNRYEGDHFGEIIWAEIAVVPHEHKYYLNSADKKDFNIYAKANYQLAEKVNAFIDLQYRTIRYRIEGIENEQNEVSVDTRYKFFNPKAGLTVAFSDKNQLYGSFGIANREPVRDDFTDNPGSTPKHETLRNLEIGFRNRSERHALHVNYYLMDYKDQLVLTGQLNDVGASVRTNVDKSYRTGVELQATLNLSDDLTWSANVTLSQNKIREFTEVLYDYGNNFDEFNVIENTYRDTDISFSPNVIAGSTLSWSPLPNAEITWLGKYVGKQYLDNTSNDSRTLNAYFVNDLRLSYEWKPSFARAISFSLLVNNLFDEKYESNGYTWGYLAGVEQFRENYYFPQAGRNFMGMVTIRF